MGSSLRILHLEDNPNDSDLIQTIFKGDGITCSLVRVATLTDFLESIKCSDFDLILAECNFPAFEGMEALAIAREKCPHLPFIFVTGKSGEELAIECLRNGAVDYIPKHRISHLVPSVFRALIKAEQLADSKRAEEALRSREQRLQEQNCVLLKLEKSTHLLHGDLKASLRELTGTVAHALEIERVGVWLFNDKRTKIRCVDLYERSATRHTKGMELIAKYYPSYFRALEEDRTIAAHDAHSDPRTKELSESYLSPHNISSVLDAPIRLGGRTIGVVCHEHVGPVRKWNLEEQNFSGSVADLASQAIEASKRTTGEAALRASEAKFRSLFENVLEGIYHSTPGGKILSANPALVRMLGYSSEAEVCELDINRDLYADPVDRMIWTKKLEQEGEIRNSEATLRRKDGSNVIVLESTRAFRDGSGGVLYYEGTLADITERKLAEEQMAMLAHAVKSISECVCITDMKDITLYVNDAFKKTYGYEEDEVMGKPITIIRSETNDPDVIKEILPATLQGGWQGEIFNRRKDGSDFPISLSTSVIRDQSGRPVALIGVSKDITEQRRAEEERKQLASFPELNPDPIIEADLAGNVNYLNPKGKELFPELQAAGTQHPLLTDLDSVIEELKRKGKHSSIRETRIGSTWYQEMIHFLPESQRIRIYAINISERKTLEGQLVQAQKLESIGQLAAGIAHEINTPTQFIGDNIQFLWDAFRDLQNVLNGYDELLAVAKDGNVTSDLITKVQATAEEAELDYLSEEIPKAIEQSLEGVQRVSTIVRAMKDFSHPGGEEKMLIDLNKTIETTITVARNEWKYVADMVTDFDSNLPLIPCLVGDLNQVILNIIINAAHAISDVVGDGSQGKGTITISTQQVDGWAEIRISDTGTGIPESARDKIFDPFFTTKCVGKGTGQGLSIAHSVVAKKHNGSLSFETELGRGTTFVVRLPVREEIYEEVECL
ncbi:MAG: PAS domain S-box protein [bacterium]